MNIVLTGSSGGIGSYLTRFLLDQGHNILGISLSKSENSPIFSEKNFEAAYSDVSNWDQISKLAESVHKKWQHVDAIICCSGSQGVMGPAMSLDVKKWSDTLRQNLDSTFYTIKAFYPLLLNSKNRAKVICFSGGGAAAPRANFSAYGAAKAGVVRLVDTLAEEWADMPIDINAVAPGAIKTRMTEEVIALGPSVVGIKEYESACKVMEKGGGSLKKVAELVEFLISSQSNYVSGKLFAAQWDQWRKLIDLPRDSKLEFSTSEIYALRRSVPEAWA